MTATRSRSPGASLLAILSAMVLGVTSMLTPAFAAGLEKFLANVALLAGEGWIMGGTGLPNPAAGPYLDQVLELYLQPNPTLFSWWQIFDTDTFQALTTPEQFCPFVCQPLPVPPLNFGDSLTQGVTNLNNAITPQFTAGDNVTVFGYSQSATIATLEMQNLISNPAVGGDNLYDPANLHFVLIGDPNNPIGGMLTRLNFPDGLDGASQHIPFLNIPLSIGATPTGPFATDIYTTEYDGWAAFPQDPTNLVAVVNAVIGILTVHADYPVADNLADTISLGSIGATNFYMIPEQLPILGPIYQLGDFGKVAGDALAPGLKLGIDWAYGNPGDPGAGITVDGLDPIGAAGPWAVTATGQLSEDTGAAGLLLRMDPLQMLAGMQHAGVQSLVNPINDLLSLVGQSPLSDSFVNSLLVGYDFTNQVDQFLLTGWSELATSLNVADLLGPAAIFNGAPLISLQPLLDLVGLAFSAFNVFGA